MSDFDIDQQAEQISDDVRFDTIKRAAIELYSSRSYRRALEFFLQLVDLRPTEILRFNVYGFFDTVPYYYLCDCFLELNEKEKAMQYYMTALQTLPHDSQSLQAFSKLSYRLGEFRKAAELNNDLAKIEIQNLLILSH